MVKTTHVKAHMRFPRTVSPVLFQEKTEHHSIKADKKQRAMKPGKRVSKHRKTYYEYRDNRSDKHPAKHL